MPKPSALVRTGSYEEILSLLEEFLETAFPTNEILPRSKVMFQLVVLREIYGGRHHYSPFFGGRRSYLHTEHCQAHHIFSGYGTFRNYSPPSPLETEIKIWR